MTKHRRQKLKRRYNLTEEDYLSLLKSQNYSCAICFTPAEAGSPLYVDHCHDSNVVRGLLCHNCNIALGHLKDHPPLAESALQYLRRHDV